MKQLCLAICFVALMMFSVSPAWSSLIDTNLDSYGFFVPSEENEKKVFADYLELTTEQFDISFNYIKIDGLSGGTMEYYTYDPGFEWYYALVKIGGPKNPKDPNDTAVSYLYWDDNGTNSLLNGDNILTTGMTFRYDVSHASFVTPKAVPEPATVFLLGFGLFGLVLASRKKNQNKV